MAPSAVSTRTTLVAWVDESTPATSRPRIAIARSVLDTCPEGSLSLGAQHTKARDLAPIASLADGTSAVSEYTPNPEHQFVLGAWTADTRDRASSGAATHARAVGDGIVRRPAELGAG
jgi:hypothetical protein